MRLMTEVLTQNIALHHTDSCWCWLALHDRRPPCALRFVTNAFLSVCLSVSQSVCATSVWRRRLHYDESQQYTSVYWRSCTVGVVLTVAPSRGTDLLRLSHDTTRGSQLTDWHLASSWTDLSACCLSSVSRCTCTERRWWEIHVIHWRQLLLSAVDNVIHSAILHLPQHLALHKVALIHYLLLTGASLPASDNQNSCSVSYLGSSARWITAKWTSWWVSETSK